MREVLETASRVAERSRHVRIDEQALGAFSQSTLTKGVDVPDWENLYHFRGSDEATVAYLLVLDTLNFCFWPARGQDRWEIDFQSEKLSGYVGLAAALKLAFESGVPLAEADYLAGLRPDQLRAALGGRGELLLFEQRVKNLNELGRLLVDEYDGRALSLVERAGGSAVALARLLADKLRSYRDVADYDGSAVCFYKRAQIFAADLYGTFQGKAWGALEDMEALTAFADYKLPQVLRHLGIFVYSPALARKIDEKTHLEPGGPEEVEIRANTIWAVERMRREMKRTGKELRAFEIDWMLWHMGQDPAYKAKPYHRTVTMFY